MKNELRVVGKNVRNVNSFKKITGRAVYNNDVRLKGMLHAKVLRSRYANAEIVDIDVSDAEKFPGVALVMSYKSAPDIFGRSIYYVGAEVALVVAETLEIAEEALGLIAVEYKENAFVIDPEAARKKGSARAFPSILPGAVTDEERASEASQSGLDNVNRWAEHKYFSERNEKGHLTKREVGEYEGFGDVEKGFAEADVIVEDSGYQFGLAHTPFMGNDCCVADFTEDKLTLYTDSQWHHGYKSLAALALNLPQSKVNLVAPVTAGSFGGRLGSGVAPSAIVPFRTGHGWASYSTLAGAASIRLGRPVRLEYSKQEDFLYHWGRGMFDSKVKIGFKSDGTLSTMDVQSWRNATTGAVTASHGPMHFDATATGNMLYSRNCEHNRYEKNFVYTNAPGCNGWQGFGNPEIFFAVESVMDIAADKLGMDPIDLRKKNHIRPGDNVLDLAYTFGDQGHYLAAGDISKCLDLGAEKIGWDKRKPSTEKTGRIRNGLGVSLTGQQTGGADFNSSTIVRLESMGSAHLICAYADLGQGGPTTQLQMVAEVLGLPFEAISHTSDSTDNTPFASYQACSSGTLKQGFATYNAALEARRQLFELAAPILAEPADNLETLDGNIYVRSAPERKISWLEAFMTKGQFGLLEDIVGYHNHKTLSGPMAMEKGATFASVDVDIETGQLMNINIVHAQDVGKALYPKAVEGVFLSIHHGVEASIGAEMILDPQTGKQLNNNWIDYPVATIQDSDVDPIIVETAGDVTHPYGATGIGQCNQSGIAPAIGNAIYNAIGVRLKEVPFSPARILRALEKVEGTVL